jgi:hypothetical protein
MEAPNQDWGLYEKRCREACVERLRSLSPSEALSIYEDLHSFSRALTTNPRGEEQYEATRWREKLARRMKLHTAFLALDRMRDGRDG